MLELVNQYVTKILLAAEDGDSINRISEKIGASYSYTYEWIERLEEIGVVERDGGVHITDTEVAGAYQSLARAVLRRRMELEDAYLLPNFAGMEYAYTKTDAVFIWTRGGYQIGRTRDDYPMFITVLEDDVAAWQEFFASFGVASSVEERAGEGIYFVLFPQEEFAAEWMENAYVTPLDETVAWAKQYEVNFQPALEMLDEMYEVGLDVEYRERETL